jgi:signal transduction histidine kinase
MAGTVWLVVALAVSFAVAASLWVGSLARSNILEQHARRLTLETDQLGSDLSQAIGARLDALRAAATLAGRTPDSGGQHSLRAVFDELYAAYPELDWLLAVDPSGVRIAGAPGGPDGALDSQPWFRAALAAPFVGMTGTSATADEATIYPAGRQPSLGELAAPVRSADGKLLGVIVTRLRWRWGPHQLARLTEPADSALSARVVVLDRSGIVVVGPTALRGKAWNGEPLESGTAYATTPDAGTTGTPRFERLPDGEQILVARAPVTAGADATGPTWQVQLGEPVGRVYQRADALAVRILWVSLGLGLATALIGAFGARHLTERLRRLTQSATALGRGEVTQISVPGGQDEVAQLAVVLERVLADLQRERTELRTLSADLERRVATRTREVERLAEEARYAAVGRERLKIARDLHDTLAHSMMAMLSEVRLLRRLQAHDPGELAGELARAEQVAHDGLREARTAIAQMRVNAVRDTGLGPALAKAFERFIDHTGLGGEFSSEAAAAHVGDERAATVFRIAEEALRNVERHARATSVHMTLRTLDGTHLELRIADDGIGFEPAATAPGHYGLVGMREQAEMIGAELIVASEVNAGTTVTIRLPLSPEPLG